MSKYRLDLFQHTFCQYRLFGHLATAILIWGSLNEFLRDVLSNYYVVHSCLVVYCCVAVYALIYGASQHRVVNVDSQGWWHEDDDRQWKISTTSRISRFFIVVYLTDPITEKTKRCCFFPTDMSELDFRRLARIIRVSTL